MDLALLGRRPDAQQCDGRRIPRIRRRGGDLAAVEILFDRQFIPLNNALISKSIIYSPRIKTKGCLRKLEQAL